MAPLTQANLALYNDREKAPAKPKMENFHKEQDPYRRFLVTGQSPHQRAEREKQPCARANTHTVSPLWDEAPLSVREAQKP